MPIALLIKFLHSLNIIFFLFEYNMYVREDSLHLWKGLLDTCVVFTSTYKCKVLREFSCYVLGFNTSES